MAVKGAAAQTARAEAGEGSGAVVLWAGVLGPPMIFLANLLVSYSMAYWACSTGNRWALDLVTLIALALVLYCGFTAWRLYVGTPAADIQAAYPRDRTRFVAMVGMLTSALFVLAVLAFTVPRLVIGPCYP